MTTTPLTPDLPPPDATAASMGRHTRERHLLMAMEVHRHEPNPGADRIIETARKFASFIEGEKEPSK